jgi:DNA-binding transcriptional LysR family regulator
VCIETQPYFGKHVLLPVLGEFAARYPQIEVELRFSEQGSGPPGDNSDLAVRRLPPSDRSQVSRRLCELPLHVVASPDYLRRAGIPRTPEALGLHDGIVARLPDGRIGPWRFLKIARGGRADSRSVEVEPRRRFLLSDQLDGVMNAALLGLGVTLMSVSPIMQQLRSGSLKLLLPGYRPVGVEHYSSVYLQYSQPRYRPRRVRLLIDFLFEYFQGTDFTRFDPSYYAD